MLSPKKQTHRKLKCPQKSGAGFGWTVFRESPTSEGTIAGGSTNEGVRPVLE